MNQAVRAIIIQDDKLLVMWRNKNGSQYFTLVGGGIDDGETPEQALVREVKEETGLDVTAHELVYKEEQEEPYATQLIYLCDISSNQEVALAKNSEEDRLNKYKTNMHKPEWVSKDSFHTLPFRTPNLQTKIVEGLKKGFPAEVENV